MNKKRFLCIYLSICLLIGLMPVPQLFAATNISSVSITVAAPVIGEQPSVTASVPDDAKYYVKEVNWGTVKTFQAGVQYTVSVLLAVREGANAQFSGSTMNAMVNENQAEWYRSSYQPGKELYVKYTFPAMQGAAASNEPIAVSGAEDLLKMRDNLSGSYYLTKDITVPENMQIFDDFSNGAEFTGTFDGKGYKINGYKANVTAKESEYPRVSLFGSAKDAVFKNLTLSGVDIKVNSDMGALVSALCNGSANCSGVTITGKISVSGNGTGGEDGGDYEIYGFCHNGSFEKCTNKTVITANCSDTSFGESFVAGIAKFGTFKNCKNTGNISSKGTMRGTGVALAAVGISIRGTLTGCKNTGAVKAEGEGDPVYAAGVSYEPEEIGKCSNSGKVTVINKSAKGSHAAGVAVKIAVESGKACTGCFNSGAVSIRQQTGVFQCGGVFAYAGSWVKECYNTGKVTVTSSKKTGKFLGEVGGVIGKAGRISECYNTGKISSNTRCQIGGVAGFSDAMDKWTVIHCYNTGKVNGKKGRGYVGGLLGSYTNGRGTAIGKYYVYDNYSTVSPIYGDSLITWKPYRGRGKKVRSINVKNCPKLSSKYWTYSKKHKRLILKNVKEK